MRYIRLRHRHNGIAMDTRYKKDEKLAPTAEGIQAFEAVKSRSRNEIAQGRGDSPVSRFAKLFVEEVEKTRFYNL